MTPEDQCSQQGPKSCGIGNTNTALFTRTTEAALESQEGGVGCGDSQVSTSSAAVSWDTPAAHFGKGVLSLQPNAKLTASASGFSRCSGWVRGGGWDKEGASKQAFPPCHQAPDERPHPGKQG